MVPDRSAKLGFETHSEKALADKDNELAELNAKHVGHVLKRALRRKNQHKSS